MTERIHCVVPFCKRTRGAHKGEPPIRGDEEWICADHWRFVDRRLKTLRRRVRQRAANLLRGAEYRRGWVHLRIGRADRTCALIWKRMKRQAIERALP